MGSHFKCIEFQKYLYKAMSAAWFLINKTLYGRHYLRNCLTSRTVHLQNFFHCLIKDWKNIRWSLAHTFKLENIRYVAPYVLLSRFYKFKRSWMKELLEYWVIQQCVNPERFDLWLAAEMQKPHWNKGVSTVCSLNCCLCDHDGHAKNSTDHCVCRYGSKVCRHVNRNLTYLIDRNYTHALLSSQCLCGKQWNGLGS